MGKTSRNDGPEFRQADFVAGIEHSRDRVMAVWRQPRREDRGACESERPGERAYDAPGLFLGAAAFLQRQAADSCWAAGRFGFLRQPGIWRLVVDRADGLCVWKPVRFDF